jgi:hypothetical protein
VLQSRWGFKAWAAASVVLVTWRGLGIEGVPATEAVGDRPALGGSRLLRDVPRAGRRPEGRGRPAPVRRAGVSRVPALRLSGRRLRSPPVRGLRPRPPGAVLVQSPRVLSELCPSALLRTPRAKSRGGGRRMAESATHLVDHVFPAVPVRQWVLTFPHRLRCRLAWDHDLCRAVVGFQRHRAREAGSPNGRGGAVTIVRRFGGAMNLNVHFHALAMDGVFVSDGAGLRFWPAPPPTDFDVAEVPTTIVPRVGRLLERRGAGDDDGASGADSWAEESAVLAGLATASVQRRFALGVRAGRSVRRCGGTCEPGEWQPSPAGGDARQEGFDLHAAVRVPADARDRLEALCRYALRPPVAQDRLALTTTGQVVLRLRNLLFDAVEDLLIQPLFDHLPLNHLTVSSQFYFRTAAHCPLRSLPVLIGSAVERLDFKVGCWIPVAMPPWCGSPSKTPTDTWCALVSHPESSTATTWCMTQTSSPSTVCKRQERYCREREQRDGWR